ncbi:MAG: universal stress protein [Actinomycetia bacterium]|nr:universal stress protein [Actinomycetes bacterium]
MRLADFRILLASDDTPGALVAVDWVRRHFEPARTRVTVVTVLVPPPAQWEAVAGAPLWADVAETDLVPETKARLAAFTPDVIVRRGDPVREIRAAAESVRPDLIVMGHRGLKGIERWMMGSVAKGVVDASDCPVLVIPEIRPGRARSA